MQVVTLKAIDEPAPEVVVHVGALSRLCPCAVDRGGGTLSLPPGLLAELGLEPGQLAHMAAHAGDRHVHLGPVVGVTLDPGALIRALSGQTSRYRTLAQEARDVGALLYLFDPSRADCDGGTTPALIPCGDGWEERSMPLPDVIYHRATYSDRDTRKQVQRLLRCICVLHGATFINRPNGFSKLEVADALRFFPNTAELAPETVAFTGPDDLEALLRRHGRVFIKADYGSHGSDVIRIIDRQDGCLVQGRFGGKEVAEVFTRRDQLQLFLTLLRAGTAWVVQQGIELPEVEDRLFDLRAIAQKDARGRWQVPLVLVRHAREGSVAANMAQGGTGFVADQVEERFGDLAAELPDLGELGREAAEKVAVALEARFGLLGEIGVDIGVDRHGRPWIFEANAKPLHPTLPDLPHSLTRYPLEYATHLAGRAWAGRYSGLPSLR